MHGQGWSGGREAGRDSGLGRASAQADASGDELSRLGLRWRPPEPDDTLLAIDGTGTPASPGTALRARELALLLAREGLAKPVAITRHQLLVDPRIACTARNRATCLLLADGLDEQAVFDYACYHLRGASADGAGPAVALLRRSEVGAPLREWGRRAKTQRLSADDARRLVREAAVCAAELAGRGEALIGVLAAIGLHAAGYDGRLLWLRGLQALTGLTLPAAVITVRCGVSFETVDGEPVSQPDDPVRLGPRPSAVFRDHRPVLLVEPDRAAAAPAWRCVALG